MSTFWMLVGAIGLVYFQNCAPAPTDELGNLGFDTDTVFVADLLDVNVNDGFHFQALNYSVSSPDVMQVFDGRCAAADDGELIQVRILRRISDDEAEVVRSLYSTCKDGRFRVTLNDVPFNGCDDALLMRSTYGEDSIAQTMLNPACS